MKRTSRQSKPPSPAPEPRLPPALLVAGAVFVAGAVWLVPFMPDDSFISFRYAEHLADGHGLVFNLGGRPVEAYSNLLWILLCALLYKMGMDLPSTTPVVGVLIGIVCLYVMWTLVRRRAPHWTQQLFPLLALAGFGPFVMYAISGMETVLFSLLLLVTVRCAEDFVLRENLRAAAWLAAAGFLVSLTRPEGVLVLPVAAGVILRDARRDGRLTRIRRPLGVAVAAFAAATIAYHAWRVLYFGDWLPTPFLSKGGEGESLWFGWYKNLHRYFVNINYYAPPQGFAFAAMFVLGFAGARMQTGGRLQGDRIALALAVVFAIVYLNFVDWMPGMRYHAPFAAVLLVPACRLHGLVPRSTWQVAVRAHPGATTALLVALGSAFVLGQSHLKATADKMSEDARLCKRPLGEWLRAVIPPGALLAIGDVGIVPYYSRLRTVDIHPQSLTDSHIAKREFSAEYVLSRNPDVIVLSVRGIYSARMDPLHFGMYGSKEFRSRYWFVGTVRAQWYEDRSYWVWLSNALEIPKERLAALPEGIGLQNRRGFVPSTADP